MLVQFGNNGIQKFKNSKISCDSQIGLGLRPGPVFAVLGNFSIDLFPKGIV